jgi:hypothetical protein
MATETKTNMTASAKLIELIDNVPTIMRTGDVDKITNLRDGILVLRALLGSGGKVTLTNGETMFVNKTGLTNAFDETLEALLSNGVVENIPTIIKREGKGRKAAEVKSVNTSILL